MTEEKTEAKNRGNFYACYFIGDFYCRRAKNKRLFMQVGGEIHKRRQ